jgi:hypothetical protein
MLPQRLNVAVQPRRLTNSNISLLAWDAHVVSTPCG